MEMMGEEYTSIYIRAAREAVAEGCYSKAFEHYVAALDYEPTLKDMYEQEFCDILKKHNAVLAVSLKIEEIFDNFRIALETFPDNYHLLNDVGMHLFKFGFFMEAMQHFQKALMMNPGYVKAGKNMNSVKNLLVERWHFRMLNDKVRNEAYRQALKEALSPSECVLDIGTGSGLLALYAAESKPFAICGCDCSAEIVELAQHVVAENNKPDILIVKGMSYELDWTQIGGKKSVLVTELFDAGLFGEHILQTIAHARNNLITKEAKIIPSRAEFFIMGVKCDRINLKYQLSLEAQKLLNLPRSNVHMLTNSESYDCEDVHLYKDTEYITKSQLLFQIDFNDDHEVIEFLENNKQFTVQLKALKTGEINVLVGWFDLHLTDNVSITTNPQCETRANAWQQAIFHDHIPIAVQQNQPIDLDFVVVKEKITIVPNNSSPIIRISAEILRFLNDSEYMKQITKCLGVITVYLGQLADVTEISLVDLCPFPLFGLLMLKQGAKSVTCCAKTDEDKAFFETVMKANNIPLRRLNILIGIDWQEEAFRNVKYHAIFCNILELCGDIDLRMRELSNKLKQNHLIAGGLYLPANVTLYCQLVTSSWLDINNRVYNENVSNYNIKKHMNIYQVSQNVNIDLSCLEYTAVTDAIELGKLGPEFGSEVIDVPISVDGVVNAIICWYCVQLVDDLGEVSTNVSNSFIDSTVFLFDPEFTFLKGDVANVLLCVDPDGSFQLLLDSERK